MDSSTREKTADKHQIYVQNAIRMSILFLITAIITTGFYIYLAIQMKAWQLYVALIFLAMFIGGASLSTLLSRRHQHERGIKILIGSGLIMLFATPLLLADLGLAVGIMAVMATVLIASQTLPEEEATRLTLISIVVGILIIIIDMFGPQYRLSVPVLQAFLPAISGLLFLILLVLFVRQFQRYSVRTKLLATTVVITALALLLATAIVLGTAVQALTDATGENLHTLAETQSLALGELLARQTNLIQALSFNETIQEVAIAQNNKYSGHPDIIRLTLELLNEEWQNASYTGSFIQSRINNDASNVMLAFRNEFRGHVEIFATDEFGAVVASTNKT
ncbi:MAG: hypothetical protein D6706_19280, partial [Chloroflexi bacterium]